jgi:hypothetical protein
MAATIATMTPLEVRDVVAGAEPGGLQAGGAVSGYGGADPAGLHVVVGLPDGE